MGDLPHGVADLTAAIEYYQDVVGLELLATVPVRDVQGKLGPNVYDARLQALMDVGGAYYRIATFRIPGTDARLRLYELINNQGIVRLRGARQSAIPTERGSVMLRLPVADLEPISTAIARTLLGDVLTPAHAAGTDPRSLTVRDEDGFLLQFVQPSPNGGAGGTRASSAAIVLTAANAEEKLRFYRDLLGLSVQIGEWEHPSGAGQSRLRRSVAVVPGADVPIEIHEYDGLHRKRFFPASVGQAGVGWMQLLVRDIDALMKTFARERVRIVSTGLQPVTFDDSRRVVVRDPDGVFVELIEPREVKTP